MTAVDINYAAVLVGGVANMIIGSIWYSPMVFGKKWMELSGHVMKEMTPEVKKEMMRMYTMTFIGALLTSFVMAHIVDYAGSATLMDGIQTGFWVWLGIVAPVLMTEYLFNKRPIMGYAISVGYHLVSLTVIGAILSMWQ